MSPEARRNLEPLMAPRAIAVIGASRDPAKLGHAVVRNILESGFPGEVYPVNPKAGEILGRRVFADIGSVPGPVDLAVVTTPAVTVLGILEACGKKGVGAAVVISAGFRETGHEGLEAEHRMREIARAYGMVVVGPNCLGVIDTLAPYNASFAAGMPRKGHIAFMSQSGALCTAVLDMSLGRGVGFSRFVSLGNKADLDEVDFIEAWARDGATRVVMAYLEGIGDGRRFVEAARRLTREKPFVAVKSGTTAAGSRAVSSHTGTLAGSERAYEAAFRQAGIVRAASVEDLFDVAVAFSRQPLPGTGGVAVVTNAGGPGIMATDAAERAGLALAALAPATMEALSAALPPAASVLNPVDVLGDATAERYRRALEIVAADPGVGALLVILSPQVMTRAAETAEAVADVAERSGKTVLACFMGEAHVREGVELLARRGVPNYPVPERAVRVLRAMADQARRRAAPEPRIQRFDIDPAAVAAVLDRARAAGRLEIGEAEARAVMEACGIPVPPSRLCATADEAVAFAESVGYPVVMKIASPDILHKSDVGGVRLGVADAGDVRDTFDLLTLRTMRRFPRAEIWGCLVQKEVRGGREVIVGMNRDPQFGPLVMFGLGGIYVEVLRDVVFRLAPFSREEAEAMVGEIRSAALLHGVRGEPPRDMGALVEALLRVSQLVTDFEEIVEMDINPLVVFEEGRGVAGIDMRLVISGEKGRNR
ncbi:CoA-binding protein [Dissulfurirhabdus thermomarina]|uniref:CoA-binding protein n=1 Tax=Dissulfurirhabdus thermomarina TaxID=1765737 RepID=A0A6N9TPT1_DISTH|nr:acetate--CoA ligase [Dissulfurirhabdus thermomarina]NDY43275.1 CoA-binding protein [Dissulfurirhabdus thermomarina]NMX24151.1 CoA-binding protein [Dissulfurirhabdus thermomarina]